LGVVVRNGLILFRTGSSEQGNEILGSMKGLDFSSPAEQLSACEGIYFMELIY